MKFFSSFSLVLFDSYWIGGTKLGNGQYFYWMGLTKPIYAYTDWKDDPNKNVNSKQCLKMVTNNGAGMNWADADSYEQIYFVCEKI